MKELKIWRYYVLIALYAVGFLATARAFGEPAPQVSGAEWFEQFVYSGLVAAASFFAMYKLIKKWEKSGDIPKV